MEIEIRRIRQADVEPGIELVLRVFHQFVAPAFRPEGIASFAEWADPAAFSERLRHGHAALVAVEGSRIVGLVECRLPSHVAMLFVDPEVQGVGLGRRLFEEALFLMRTRDPEVRTVSVHAAPYAVSFYRRLGFRETDGEQERNGIRFTPMLFAIGA